MNQATRRLRHAFEGYFLEEDHQLRPAGVSSARTLPVDSESRFPLIEQIKPQAIDEPPVVLDETQWATVREFISVAKSQGQIEADGVTANVSLLVYGPSRNWQKSSRQIYCGRVGTRALRHKA